MSLDYPIYFVDHSPGHPLAGFGHPACTTEIPFSIELPDCTLQMPTPSTPFSSPPVLEEDPAVRETTVTSVSATFHPTAHTVDPDIILASSDDVLFYVHLNILKNVSPHAFYRVFEMQRTTADESARDALPSPNPEGIFDVPETSAVLNVLLHMIYGASLAQYSPSFEILMAAVNRMPYYSLNPKDYIVPHTPLFELLLTHAPLFPLQLYALAGHHDLEELAIPTSSHLLYPLTGLTEGMAEEMGAIYLKRLFCLHLNRFNALKKILLQPLYSHPPTKECGFVNQKQLMRAWAEALTHYAWDTYLELTMHSMQTALRSLGRLDCAPCRECLQKRIKEVVIQWACVKRTI